MTKPTLEDAIILAAERHKGQTDKAGKPYILHPLRVMFHLPKDAGEDARIAAVLHDVIEDGDVSFENLRDWGYSDEVIAALRGVTKLDENEDYDSFIRRLAPNSLARLVKLADLEDNLDRSRIAQMTPKDEARMEKYRRAKEYLAKFGATDEHG